MNASNNDYWVDELSCKPCLKFVGAVYICSARRKKTCTRSSFSSTVCWSRRSPHARMVGM